MDSEHIMDALSETAGKEHIPVIDVTDSVLRKLRAPAPAASNRSLFWLLAGSGAAAAAAAGYALTVLIQDPVADFATLQDPLSSIISFVFSFASSVTGVLL